MIKFVALLCASLWTFYGIRLAGASVVNRSQIAIFAALGVLLGATMAPVTGSGGATFVQWAGTLAIGPPLLVYLFGNYDREA